MTKILLGLLIIFLSGLGLYFYHDGQNFYQSGDSDKFAIHIGDTFTIKVRLNPSTGEQNCWTNKDKCNFIKEIDRQFERDFFSNNCEGCGGTESWTFQATEKGTDTIKIEMCPRIGERKDCNFFSGDSLRQYSGDNVVSTYAPYRQVDYKFIVTITD